MISYGIVHLLHSNQSIDHEDDDLTEVVSIYQFFSLLFGFAKPNPPPIHIVASFDVEDQQIDLSLQDETHTITFNEYRINDCLPLTMYKTRENAVYCDYYNMVIRDEYPEKIWHSTMESYPMFSNIDNRFHASPYNVIYREISTHASNGVFGLAKMKYRNSFLFAYDTDVFSRDETITILKHIFVNN